MAQFGDWMFSVDRDATVRAYAQAERGGSDRCTCDYCRNFRLAREKIFPAGFLALLDQLGIDWRKEAEAYRTYRVSPGRHDYGGWYHFVGRLEKTGDFAPIDFGNGFTAWMAIATAPRLESMKAVPAVELGFHTDSVPWLLDEPESD